MTAFKAECGKYQYYLMVGAVDVNEYPAPIGTFTTDGIAKELNAKMSHSGTYQVQVISTNGAEGTVTLQQSSDGVAWDDLPDATDVPVPANDSVSFERDFFAGKYLRATHNGTVAGNITIILTLS